MKKPYVPKQNLELFLETSTSRVLNVLFIYPEKEFSLTDIAKESKVAKAHIGKILMYLEKIGFIEIIKLSKIWRIKANIQNKDFIKRKIIHNLNFIYASGLAEFLNNEFSHPRAIILFGSFRKGEDLSSSDIDIAIETDIEEYTVLKPKNLSSFENIIHRNIQLHLFNRKNVDINVFNNIANGIIISGFLEVKP